MSFELFCVWFVIMIIFTLVMFGLGFLSGKYPTGFWISFVVFLICYTVATWNIEVETAKTGSDSFFYLLKFLWGIICFSIGNEIGKA